MESKSKEPRSKRESMSRLSDKELEELLYSKNTPMSRQSTMIQDIRIEDGKER